MLLWINTEEQKYERRKDTITEFIYLYVIKLYLREYSNLIIRTFINIFIVRHYLREYLNLSNCHKYIHLYVIKLYLREYSNLIIRTFIKTIYEWFRQNTVCSYHIKHFHSCAVQFNIKLHSVQFNIYCTPL